VRTAWLTFLRLLPRGNPGGPARFGSYGKRATFPLLLSKQPAAFRLRQSVTAVTSYRSSTPLIFGRRAIPPSLFAEAAIGGPTAMRGGRRHGQKIALTAIIDQTNNFAARADQAGRAANSV
jgi:hypothetical protein